MNGVKLLIASILASGVVGAQAPLTAGGAELSVPFGSAKGHIAVIDRYLLFVNQANPGSSFAVERSNVIDATVQNDTVIVRTRERVGELNQFTFRLDDPMQAGAVVTWARETGGSAGTMAPGLAAAPAKDDIIGEYQVRHNHWRGGCDGKLVITATQVLFESVTDIDHSRRWSVADVKEMKRENPYEVEINPFTGDSYKFNLVGGEGMSSEEYKLLMDRVTEGRLGHR